MNTEIVASNLSSLRGILSNPTTSSEPSFEMYKEPLPRLLCILETSGPKHCCMLIVARLS